MKTVRGRPRKPPNVIFIERPKVEVLFGEAAEAYKRFKLIERKLDRHMERCINIWNNAFAGRMCSDINQTIVDEWVAKHMTKLQPNSVARYIIMLKAILNDAHARGMLDVVPKIKPPTFFDERDEHLSAKEVGALVTWATRNLDPLEALCMATFIYTGVRVNELCFLKGTDFGGLAMTVTKKKGKTRNTRTVPYAATYLHLFAPDKVADSFGGNPVFKEIGRTPEVMSNKMGALLRMGLDATGVTRNVRVHDLRHTFAFLCGTAGMDLGDLQTLMGHANLSMTMRYRGFIQSRAHDVMAKM